MRTKNIVVTGSTGLVGRAVREELSNRRFLQPTFLTRREPLSGRNEVRSARLDAPAAEWEAIFRGTDCVIHLAGRVPTRARKQTLSDMLASNVDGSRTVALGALRAGVRRFVYLSSLAVYGPAIKGKPFYPDSPLDPVTPYGLSKFQAEEQLKSIFADTDTKLIILRPPAVYASGAGGMIGSLIARVRTQSWLPLLSIQSNRRQFISAANIGHAIVHACTADGASGPALLPADNEVVSTSEFIQLLAAHFQQPVRGYPIPEGVFRFLKPIPRIGQLAAGVVGDSFVDDVRLRTELRWTAPYTLLEGIEQINR